jgi:DNA-binding MarR family transcriptional regulator
MLERNFERVYNKFKLSLYAKVFQEYRKDADDALTTQEVISMEIINALGEPSVNEFASMATLSTPNATYRVNQLVKKGFIEKIQSEKDKREFHLRMTPKYDEIYGDVFHYVDTICERIRARFPEEDVKKLDEMLGIIASELMHETDAVRLVASRDQR